MAATQPPPESHYSHDLPWQIGWHHAAAGKTQHQNPFTSPEPRQAWYEGWLAWHNSKIPAPT